MAKKVPEVQMTDVMRFQVLFVCDAAESTIFSSSEYMYYILLLPYRSACAPQQELQLIRLEES